MITKIFLFLARFYLNKINKSRAVRNLIMWPIASRVFGKKYDTVIKLKNNLLMNVDLGDMLGRMVIFYGPYREYFWEPATTKLMELLIKNASEAIVAGTHIGYTVLSARRAMAKNTARLHTFEPVKYLFDISQKNILLNKDIGKISISRLALNDKTEKVKIALDTLSSRLVPKNNKNSDKTIEIVEGITIDDYMEQRGLKKINFMLLDVEGNELNVLRGMKNTFLKSPPKDIIFEVNCVSNEDLNKLNVISEFLQNFGYALYFIEDDYKFLDFKREFDEINLRALAGATDFDKKHCNMLATKRPAEELISLSLKIT